MAGSILWIVILEEVLSLPSHCSWTVRYWSLVTWCRPWICLFMISAQVMVLVMARPDPVNRICLSAGRPPCWTPPCMRAMAKPSRFRILLPSFTRISRTPSARPGIEHESDSVELLTFRNPLRAGFRVEQGGSVVQAGLGPVQLDVTSRLHAIMLTQALCPVNDIMCLPDLETTDIHKERSHSLCVAP